jgi:hypothetical protein
MQRFFLDSETKNFIENLPAQTPRDQMLDL